MCIYILLTPLCPHPPRLLAGPSCDRIQRELSRIHESDAWADAAARARLPFDMPDACAPGPGNVVRVPSGHWCGWECRNTYGGGNGDVEGDVEGLGEEGLGVCAGGAECNGGGGSWDFSGEDVLRVGAARAVEAGIGDGDGEEGVGVNEGVDGGAARMLGMPDAEYGVPRVGVGWRE
ncbi:hypothetical protein F5B20DRAFT_574893 [Whalleya microplaca]|nr:hypothetical protein F5B20DRAFT_574893 [Whalleya microplaca]